MAGSKPVVLYLGRYTHRVAISNHRLASFDGEQVTFRWKDYARGNKQRLMTLSASEFLRRYVQHVLPHSFVRIRQFGFLANRYRSKSIALIRRLLTSEPQPQEPLAAAHRSLFRPLEQYQKTFEPPYASRPASGFLLVSLFESDSASTCSSCLDLSRRVTPEQG